MSDPVKVFLAGEGKNELGGRIGPAAFHNSDKRGVLEALLEKVRAKPGWVVEGAREWKSYRKFTARGIVDAETRAVMGAALDAREANCQVLAFCRDRDKDIGRKDAIEDGMKRLAHDGSSPLGVIGGVAIPTLEGWVLALMSQSRTDSLSPARAAEKLIELGVPAKDTDAMVRIVDQSNLDAVPVDAQSLRRWLERARDVMARHVP